MTTHDNREVLELHAQTSKKLELLRGEYEARLEAGEKVEAQRVLQGVKKLEMVVRALQAQMKT